MSMSSTSHYQIRRLKEELYARFFRIGFPIIFISTACESADRKDGIDFCDLSMLNYMIRSSTGRLIARCSIGGIMLVKTQGVKHYEPHRRERLYRQGAQPTGFADPSSQVVGF